MRPPQAFVRIATAAAVCSVFGLSVAGSATAGDSPPPAKAVSLHHFATAPKGATKPDDITRLGHVLWVTYQNDAGKTGTPPGPSTIVGFDERSGQVVQTFSIVGRVDGLTADPRHHRLLATVNEDLNSSFYVIEPGSSSTPTHYTYSPDPNDGTANGGTDAISVGSDGTVYLAHSNPDPAVDNANTAAVYTLRLSGTTALLTRLFGVNDPAAIINPAPGGPTSGPLGLTDPDSNRFLPGRDGGTLVQDAQADSKLVLATDLHAAHPDLRQLNLVNAVPPSGTNPDGSPVTPQLDDVARVAGPGLLYVVDQGGGDIWTVDTAKVEPGTMFVSQPAPAAGDQPNDPALGVVDPQTGVVTHVNATLKSPKGLLFVGADDHGEGDGGDR